MSIMRIMRVSVVLVVCVALAGCSAGGGTSGGGSGGASSPAPTDSVLTAEKAATKAMEGIDPEAALLTAGSGGVVTSPPPKSWTFLYASKAKGRIYQVSVEHGKASAPEDVAPFDPAKIGESAALPIDSLKVGSKQAYETGKTYLEKRDGFAPPNVLMSIGFVEVTGLEDQSPGDWLVAFVTGTSTEGMKQVRVDGQTAEVTPIE